MDGRLGPPLRGQPEPADRAGEHARQEADRRRDQRGEQGDQGRAEDEHDLVDDGLEGERRLPADRIESGRPPRPHHRSDVRPAGAGRGGEQEPAPPRASGDHRRDECDAADEERRHGQAQHAPLPSPVHGAGPERAGHAEAQGERAGHGAGEAVAAGLPLDQEHRPETQHRRREAAHPAGEGERRRSGHAEETDVGTEDGAGRHGSLALSGHERVREVLRRSLGWRPEPSREGPADRSLFAVRALHSGGDLDEPAARPGAAPS